MPIQKSALRRGHPGRGSRNSGVSMPAASAHPLRQSPQRGEGARHHMPRMLIVDDNVEAADSLASLLQAAGHGEARIAYTGKAALALVANFVPTLLFVDLDLADMSGYDVARHLSQHPSLRKLRMIALTGSSQHAGRELARESGFERFLIKPVVAAALDEVFAPRAQ
jgi:CheY-like chemotaxis protein